MHAAAGEGEEAHLMYQLQHALLVKEEVEEEEGLMKTLLLRHAPHRAQQIKKMYWVAMPPLLLLY